MLGAIIGDVIGSVYEFANVKYKNIELFTEHTRFTDDTILTIAVADCILHQKPYDITLQDYGRRYPDRGYGRSFLHWLDSKSPKPYNSYGNGSGMRVSPVGFAFNDLDTILKEAKKSAEITHNHLEGIKGAQAIASAIYLARVGKNKEEIKEYIESTFHYSLKENINQIRPYYHFVETSQGSVPQAIRAFIDSKDFEDAIRNAVSIGGDADTIACMTGGIAQAFYKIIPPPIIEKTLAYLPEEFKNIITEFNNKYNIIY